MNKFTYRGWKLDYVKKQGIVKTYVATGPGGNMVTKPTRVEIEREIDKEIAKNEPAWVLA